MPSYAAVAQRHSSTQKALQEEHQRLGDATQNKSGSDMTTNQAVGSDKD